ncbi:MAG: lytic transglycosylase domain-containing protein [Candidatus Binatia bacterium]
MRTTNVLTYKTVGLALLLLLWCGGSRTSAESNEQTQLSAKGHFPYPASLRPQVEFWKKIFGTHSKFQSVIHDAENMKVYKVLDFRPLIDEEGLDEAIVYQIKQDQTKLEIERIRSILLTLHKCSPNCQGLNAEEQKVWNLYRNVKGQDKFQQAAGEDRLRSQTGVKERFAEGIRVSRRYLKAMEAIFRQTGVPVELTRLPFIESSFNVQAYSKVGAAGIWQFMPATGRMYNMRINNLVDERRDPLIASEAAARFLKANYEKLGTWPLAITAYNHGPAGMAAAVDAVGTTDIETIIKSYKGSRFGFASRNFYPEFLAALQVEKNFADHFGPLHTETPLVHEKVTVDLPIPLRTAARFAGTDEEELILLNPALSETVRAGRAAIPQHYGLRIPSGALGGFLKAYSPWQSEEKARLAALERARKAKLASSKKTKRTRQVAKRGQAKTANKKAVVKAKSTTRNSVREAQADEKSKKPRG